MGHRSKTRAPKQKHRIGCRACSWRGSRVALDGGGFNDSPCPRCGSAVSLAGWLNEPIYEVTDGYGKIHYAGSLMGCGVWIDPIFGVDFDHSLWGEPGIDEDRIERYADGSFTVHVYDYKGRNAGEFYVRQKVER